MVFPLFKAKLDPDAGLDGPYVLRIALPPGTAMSSPSVTAQQVDPATGAPLAGVITVSNLAMALNDSANNIWWVSVYLLSDGTLGTYELRCRYSVSTTPATTRDRTMRIVVANN